MHSTPLALGEIGPGAFLAITVGYIIGGILCIILAATGFGGTTGRGRVVTGIIGGACLIYAVYLLTGDADTVFISYYIMALPVILLIRAIVVFFQRRKGTAPQQVNPANPTGTSWPPAQVPGQPAPWPNQQYPGQQPQPGQPFPGQQPYPTQPQGQPFPGQQGQPIPHQPQQGQPFPAQQQPQQAQPFPGQPWPAQQADPTAPAPATNAFPPPQQPYPPAPPQGR
jgi:hypothetical protein